MHAGSMGAFPYMTCICSVLMFVLKSHRVHASRLVVGAHGFEWCQTDGGAQERCPPEDKNATAN